MPLILHSVQHVVEDFGLSPEAIDPLWEMELHHFWHRARNRWIARALAAENISRGARVLEVGCGSGVVAKHLHLLGYVVTGIDTAELLVRKAFERCSEATFVVGDVGAWRSPLPFDAICFFDVLEHLDDPQAMVRACFAHARPGTVFAATVPAQRSLQTVIDELSGHKRRYEVGELGGLFEAVGLRSVRERGIFRSTVPFQRFLRRRMPDSAAGLSPEDRRAILASNARIPPNAVNFGLDALCRLELSVGFSAADNRPGASLLVTGRWPG